MQQGTNELLRKFEQLFGAPPSVMVRAPGRVDLLGSHTDYNEGFVLPVAVDLDVIAAGAPREDRTVAVYSANFDQMSEFELADIRHDPVNKWSNYIRGVALFLMEAGADLHGANVAIHGSVPIGSGLSSSAAIEMASGYLFQQLFGFEMSGTDLALVGQKAENRFVGVNTGIMDQFISRLARRDHALFIDCRTLEYEQVPFETSSVKIVVCDTMKRRGLVDSEYDLRRSQCEEAARLFGQWVPDVRALRDVSVQDFEKHQHQLPDVICKRARHVIYENERVLASREALGAGDFAGFGRMMDASHDSARDLYEVSCAELEAMVEVSRAAPGALCARVAGAGFGGCTVSLVTAGCVERFVDEITAGYQAKTGLAPALYVCEAAEGASVVWESDKA